MEGRYGDPDDRRERPPWRGDRPHDEDERRSDRYDRRERSPHRDRSRSPARPVERKRRRPTWFDIPPVNGLPPPWATLPGAVQVVPQEVAANNVGSANVTVASQQATRHARRVYVGGLPPSVTDQMLGDFFTRSLAAVGGVVEGPGSCVLNVYVNQEKKFAFVELRSVEETSNAIALDGIMFEGTPIRIRRPADYQAAVAVSLGPSQPNPNLNLAAVGIRPNEPAAPAPPQTGAPAQAAHQGHPDAAHRIFVGGLPYYLTEEQIRELLGSFGVIKSFDLIRDRETQQSKGYGFVVYEDPAVTDIACAGLHGMRMGERHLTVRLANEGVRLHQDVRPAQEGVEAAPKPPVVVKLAEAITLDEIADDNEYSDILEDMQEECSKYGTVVKVHIPRPGPPGAPPVPGLGKVLIEFADSASAVAARNAMHGKKFAGRTVSASLVTDDDYRLMRWD